MVKKRLDANHDEVAMAFDGVEGFAKASSEKPDLILLGIMMPAMDGFEVLKRLKDNEETRSIPVVMLTAKGETRAILQAQHLRVTDYVIKPFESEELLNTVRRCID